MAEKYTKYGFTRMQYEVFKLIQLGETNVEIARKLNISIDTAKAHASAIFIKMNLQNRKQVIIRAISEGIN